MKKLGIILPASMRKSPLSNAKKVVKFPKIRASKILSGKKP